LGGSISERRVHELQILRAGRRIGARVGVEEHEAAGFENYDLSLGELLESVVLTAFAGRRPLSDSARERAAELMRIYGLDLDSIPGALAEERG
jgi:hypothetical protein